MPHRTKSIAVLPFENLSEEKANAFFTEGVQDEILTDLAKIAELEGDQPHLASCSIRAALPRNLREIGAATRRRACGRRQRAARGQQACGSTRS